MARYAILQQFYASTRWQSFRAAIIAERGLQCEVCGGLIAREGEATLHHMQELTPDNVSDVMVALNPANVQVIHRSCHDAIHGRFGHERGKQVFVVYGMPLSGKSALVAQQMRRGDLVIDMNLLFEAVTGLSLYDKPDSLLANVRAAYNLLIDQVKTRYGKWSTAWVVGGFADKFGRERLADDLGAELVYCECTREEALARLMADERRRNMAAEYTKYIDEWIERYTA